MPALKTYGPVERLLSRTSAEHLVGAFRPTLGGEFPWSFSYGARPQRYSLRTVMITLVLIIAGTVLAVGLALQDGWNAPKMMALSLVAYLILSMVVPRLIGRKRGGSGWERQVMIDGTNVRVIDRYGTTSTQWRQPLRKYLDLRHRVMSVGGKRFSSNAEPTALDIIELRHRDPARSIYLLGRRRPRASDRTNLTDQIKAGRRDAPTAAADPIDGPGEGDLELLLGTLSTALDLPVTHESS